MAAHQVQADAVEHRGARARRHCPADARTRGLAAGEHDDTEEAEDFPPIVAETRVDVPDATVSDAVMMLDLRNTNALMFRNSGSGVLNVVYRRADGCVGWIDAPAG